MISKVKLDHFKSLECSLQASWPLELREIRMKPRRISQEPTRTIFGWR